MPADSLLVPNYAKETFRKLLKDYPSYPQELVRSEDFIVSRLDIHAVPTFYKFAAEATHMDGIIGVMARKIVNESARAAPQLEDKVSIYRGGLHLGSTRTFKVINTANPFRIIESEIADRAAFGDYLAGIAHLAAYCDKVDYKGVDASLAMSLRYAASLAVVTRFCLVGEDQDIVSRCQDIIINPLPRRGSEPIRSLEIRYAGQT